MNWQSEKLRKEYARQLGIIPTIDMENFTMLFLADLASKTPITLVDGIETHTVCLKSNYKSAIESIMYNEDGLGLTFSELIDVTYYYEYQKDWEKGLSKTIDKVCCNLDKECWIDIDNNTISIDFTTQEIENIKKLHDKQTLAYISYFTDLIYNYEEKVEENTAKFSIKKVINKVFKSSK